MIETLYDALLKPLFALADDASFWQLAIAALVARVAMGLMVREPHVKSAFFAFGVSMVMYFAHRFTYGDEFFVLVGNFLRSLFVGQIVSAVVALLMPWYFVLLRHIDKIREQHAVRALALAVEQQNKENEKWERARQAAKKPAAPPLSPEERRARFIAKAKADHEAENKRNNELDLDPDEREVVNMQAKQRFLRKIKEGGEL